MARKVSSKLPTRNSGSGRAAGLERDAPVQRARGASTSKASDLEMEQVSEEILRLVEASREGRLEERGKIDRFQGIHRQMVQGINEMLDAILLPIAEGNRILAQISNGKIDELIAQTLREMDS